MARAPIRILYLIVGWTALALGFIGVFVPVLPTTPFVLLAAYCFSRGSRRMHAWLLSRPLFGPMIQNWESYGAIGKRAKWIATAMLLPLFGFTLVFVRIAAALKAIIAATGLAVLAYIWTRPLPPRGKTR